MPEPAADGARPSPSPSPSPGPQTLLAFDFGLRRTGVAVASTLIGEARPLDTVQAEGEARWAPLAALVAAWQPDALVVGIPRHPDGTEHELTRAARRFARELARRHGLPVHEVDERYSSVEAEAALRAEGGRRARPGRPDPRLDARAAAVLLDQYLAGGG